MPLLASSASSALSAQWLADALVNARLFDQLQLGPYLSEFRSQPGATDAAALGSFLVEAGLLTAYQAERALEGEAAKLCLGPYMLAEPIGSGSLGTVFQAVSRVDRKRYAVKVLPLRSLWNVHLAKQQVQVFAQLPAHPAVVPFVDVDTAGGFHYLVWPFVLGKTLQDVVRSKGPRPTDQAVTIAAQIAEGLLLCHTHDVSHGLLKPSNLLMGNDGQARILDLGVGAILSENIADDESMLDTISTANAAMGMLDYAAPETLNNPQLRAPSGDVYSFGCTLYYLLTGGMPFPEGNAVDKILAHQTQTPRPIRDVNPTVSAWLESLVLRMMAKSPEDRPGTADVLASLLNGDYRAPKLSKPVPVTVPQTESVAALPPGQEPLPNSTPWLLQLAPRAMVAEQETDAAGERTDTTTGVPDLPLSEPTDPLMGSSAEMPMPPVSVPKPSRVSMFGNTPAVVQAPKTPTTPQKSDARFGAPSPPASSNTSTDMLPLPVNFADGSDASLSRPNFASVEVPTLPPFAKSIWRRLWRRITLWKPHADVVQLSVFGPPTISPGDNVALQVFAHTPEGFESVQTLAKVFHQNGELLATGYVQREVKHGEKLGLHLGVVNAGVARPEVELTWRGQPQPRKFDLYVPWESPAGPSPTVLSAGLNRVLSGRIAFTLKILPRRA